MTLKIRLYCQAGQSLTRQFAKSGRPSFENRPLAFFLILQLSSIRMPMKSNTVRHLWYSVHERGRQKSGWEH